MRNVFAAWVAALLLVGCEDAAVETPKRWTNGSMPVGVVVKGRWYGPEQIETGRALFTTHCSECHGANAEGAPNWRQIGPDGKHPPPPLNGTGHSWHHPLAALRFTVNRGGAAYGGVMPGFADKLDDREVDAVLAWAQSHWSDEIYGLWSERDRQAH